MALLFRNFIKNRTALKHSLYGSGLSLKIFLTLSIKFLYIQLNINRDADT